MSLAAAVSAAVQHSQAATAACTCAHQQQSPWQQQQTRSYAAAKAKGKQQQKGGAKGKKGQQAPKKKVKQRMESKPFDDKDPLLQRVVSMLVPQEHELPAESPEQQAEAQARAKAYSSMKMAEHKAWRADLHTKLQLKAAALKALPPALREHALKEDLEPFPLTRNVLYETPPESYRS